jgi:hypothetical protein
VSSLPVRRVYPDPLATRFAEEFFQRFVCLKRTLGEAVRGARLALLSSGNPLGLIYVRFAVPRIAAEGANLRSEMRQSPLARNGDAAVPQHGRPGRRREVQDGLVE